MLVVLHLLVLLEQKVATLYFLQLLLLEVEVVVLFLQVMQALAVREVAVVETEVLEPQETKVRIHQ